MIKSMTAFATAAKKQDNVLVETQIRCYNSKYLDIVLRLPWQYNFLEEKIKERITQKLSRGRVELKLRICDQSEDANAYEINEGKATAYYRVLQKLKKTLDIDDSITLKELMSVEGIIQPVEDEKKVVSQWPVICACIDDALTGVDTMRKKEGDFIRKDFAARMAEIEKNVDTIEAGTVDLLTAYQERLKERITRLTQGIVDVETERIAQEAAFLADKSDISEELVRTRSHIVQFREIIDGGEPGGRKLNFMLQEFMREFNTMGAKIGKADMAHIIVNVKAELEKIREQVQNVE